MPPVPSGWRRRYILTEQRDKKFAVIENEFGAESIDSIILGEGNSKMQVAEKMISMDNGQCVTGRDRGRLLPAAIVHRFCQDGCPRPVQNKLECIS